MPDLSLGEITRITEAATPGPWKTYLEGWQIYGGTDYPDHSNWVATTNAEHDAEFVIMARNEMPALIERVRGAESQRDAALARIARVEALHAKHENTIHTTPEFVCAHRHCVDDAGDQCAWPCATWRALTEGTNDEPEI